MTYVVLIDPLPPYLSGDLVVLEDELAKSLIDAGKAFAHELTLPAPTMDRAMTPPPRGKRGKE